MANRGEMGSRLGLVLPGDVICKLNLDGLRELNETVGHEAGDEVLRRLGQLLNEQVRDGDFVGRYGDDFIMVLAGSPVTAAERRVRHLAAS